MCYEFSCVVIGKLISVQIKGSDLGKGSGRKRPKETIQAQALLGEVKHTIFIHFLNFLLYFLLAVVGIDASESRGVCFVAWADSLLQSMHASGVIFGDPNEFIAGPKDGLDFLPE